jgi:hypothetical protein
MTDQFFDCLAIRIPQEIGEEAVEESVVEGVAGGFERAESSADGCAEDQAVQNVFIRESAPYES